MNIFSRSLYIFIFTSILISCTPETVYIKPELRGKVYDSNTQKPIVNTEGYAGFYLGEKEENKIKTNDKGEFYLRPIYKNFYLFMPNIDESIMGAPQVYISMKGYENKTYNYSIKYQEQNKNIDMNPMVLGKVDVGIIYLDPEE